MDDAARPAAPPVASDAEPWTRPEPDSPCRRVCVIHPQSRLCLGCYRTPEEIAAWPAMAREARRALMAELPSREPLLRGARRGGRGARLAGG